jgi:predicted lipoprotein with Yx(FWY)xxD motif
MRKSGWAAAAGLGSLVLLLTACGGSSGSSSTSTPATTSTTPAAGQPTSGAIPAKGSTVLIVQKSALGFVLALANGQVVYEYGKDTKGGTPACVGSCASAWPPVTGNPVASAASTGLGTFGTVAEANGAKQITYDGMPLYTFKGARPLATKGEGVGGMWHVIKLSKSNVTGA